MSTLAGAKDVKAAIRWAKPGTERITTTFETNLRVAYRALAAISEVEGPSVARAVVCCLQSDAGRGHTGPGDP